MVDELVKEVADAGGVKEFEKSGAKEPEPQDAAAQNFIDEAAGK